MTSSRLGRSSIVSYGLVFLEARRQRWNWFEYLGPFLILLLRKRKAMMSLGNRPMLPRNPLKLSAARLTILSKISVATQSRLNQW